MSRAARGLGEHKPGARVDDTQERGLWTNEGLNATVGMYTQLALTNKATTGRTVPARTMP